MSGGRLSAAGAMLFNAEYFSRLQFSLGKGVCICMYMYLCVYICMCVYDIGIDKGCVRVSKVLKYILYILYDLSSPHHAIAIT